jgi:hypothetical protein
VEVICVTQKRARISNILLIALQALQDIPALLVLNGGIRVEFN